MLTILLLLASAALATAGFGALLLIWLRWDRVEGFAKRSQAKPAVALCRAALGTAGLLRHGTAVEQAQAPLYEKIGRLEVELDWVRKKAARLG